MRTNWIRIELGNIVRVVLPVCRACAAQLLPPVASVDHRVDHSADGVSIRRSARVVVAIGV